MSGNGSADAARVADRDGRTLRLQANGHTAERAAEIVLAEGVFAGQHQPDHLPPAGQPR